MALAHHSAEAAQIKNEASSPRGLGKRHMQIFLLFLGMVIGYMLRVALSVAVVAMTKGIDKTDINNTEINNPDIKTYNWDQTEKSLILSSFFWGYVVTQIPSGYLASVWSAKNVLSIGLFICGFLNILVPLVADIGGWMAVCACRVGMGLSQACLLPCTQTLLAKWVPPAERARLGTLAYAGAQMGTVIGMPVSGLLADSQFHWPSIFYVIGSLGVAWGLLFFFCGSDSPAKHSSISNEEKTYIEESLGSASSKKQSEELRTPWRQIFTSIPMWALIIVHCGQNWGYWLLVTEIPTYMDKVVGFSIKENGFMSALPYLAMWVLSFPTSWLSDYALEKGAPKGIIRKTSNTIAHWGPALALIVLCFVSTDNKTLPVVILVIAVGLNAGSLCGFQINHIDLSPNFAGVMMSITNCISGFISILAPIACGLIVNEPTNVNQWHTVFYISALIYFVGNLIFITFGEGEIQWWNDSSSVKSSSRNKRVYQISSTGNNNNTTTPTTTTCQWNSIALETHRKMEDNTRY